MLSSIAHRSASVSTSHARHASSRSSRATNVPAAGCTICDRVRARMLDAIVALLAHMTLAALAARPIVDARVGIRLGYGAVDGKTQLSLERAHPRSPNAKLEQRSTFSLHNNGQPQIAKDEKHTRALRAGRRLRAACVRRREHTKRTLETLQQTRHRDRLLQRIDEIDRIFDRRRSRVYALGSSASRRLRILDDRIRTAGTKRGHEENGSDAHDPTLPAASTLDLRKGCMPTPPPANQRNSSSCLRPSMNP